MQRLKDQVNRKHENIEKSEDQDNQVREDQVHRGVKSQILCLIQFKYLDVFNSGKRHNHFNKFNN